MRRTGLSVALLIASLGVALATSEGRADASRHRVVQGDTLSKLARKSGCTVAGLQKANRLKSTMIFTGQTLELPDCSAKSSSKKKPKPARAARPSSSSSRDHEPIAPSRGDRGTSGTKKMLTIEHVVADGDTLGSIAAVYNAKLSDIRTWNKLKRDTLELGKTLIVARREETPRKDPPPPPEMTAEEALAAAGRAAAAMGEDGGDGAGATGELPRPAKVKDPYGDVTLDVRTDETDEDDLAPSVARGTWTKGQSVGKPWEGSLTSPAKLTEGDGYYIRRPYRAYGADHVVAQIKDVLDRMHERFPDRHDLAVGDISAEDGGSISEHHSHQTGRDLDIGFYFKKKPKGYPSGFVVGEKDTLDFKATWGLLKAFLDTSRQRGGVQMIFLDYDVQKMIYEWAQDHEVPDEYLDWAFQYPRGKKASGGVVRHEPNHDDHFHVRFRCPPSDDVCE
jgi:LysM repeat protein